MGQIVGSHGPALRFVTTTARHLHPPTLPRMHRRRERAFLEADDSVTRCARRDHPIASSSVAPRSWPSATSHGQVRRRPEARPSRAAPGRRQGDDPGERAATARPRGSWRSPSQPCGQRLATRGVVVSRLIERSDSRQLNLVGAQPPLRARHDVIIRSTHQGGDRARRQHRFDRCAVVASHRRERGRGVRRRPPRGGARRSGPPRPDRHPWHRPPSLPPRR